MTVPVEIHLETENQNYRMFLQKNDNMVQVAAKQQVSFLFKIFPQKNFQSSLENHSHDLLLFF